MGKGIGGVRGYAGAPFSTGRGDDCYGIKKGAKSSCSRNQERHHAALCYCMTKGTEETLGEADGAGSGYRLAAQGGNACPSGTVSANEKSCLAAAKAANH